MGTTVAEWKNAGTEANGVTDELEVVLYDGAEGEELFYEGSFANIPNEVLNRHVIQSAKIILSSVPERVGAFSLTI